MKTMRVYQLTHLSPTLFRRLKEAQMEAACVEGGGCVTKQSGDERHCTLSMTSSQSGEACTGVIPYKPD
jgi:hypothetical protein